MTDPIKHETRAAAESTAHTAPLGDRAATDDPGPETEPAAVGDPAAVTQPPAIYTAQDRPRGLNAYFAPGGEDDASGERRADERRNLRLLLLMVAALVLIPTLLTIAAFAQELVNRRGG